MQDHLKGIRNYEIVIVLHGLCISLFQFKNHLFLNFSVVRYPSDLQWRATFVRVNLLSELANLSAVT
jgi:hypothetical protein